MPYYANFLIYGVPMSVYVHMVCVLFLILKIKAILMYFYFCFHIFRHSFPLSLKLECSAMILVHYNLRLLGSSNSALASKVSGTTGTCHHTQLIFIFLVEIGFHHVGQVGLKLLISYDPPTSASQSAGIPGKKEKIWVNPIDVRTY
uniref:Uncharacterized protein n=1 Tax=Callithrix jacchus TaxID=9483 RepID=A0A8I3W3V2_CALJA